MAVVELKRVRNGGEKRSYTTGQETALPKDMTSRKDTSFHQPGALAKLGQEKAREGTGTGTGQPTSVSHVC